MVAPKNSHRQTPRDLSAEDIRLDLDDAYKVIKLSEDLGATDTEVFMVKAIGSDFSIEKDMVKFASAGTEFGIGIRVIKNKRLGFGYCTSLAQAEGAIKNALSTTKLRKEMEFQFTPVTEQREIPSIFDSSILELTVEEGLYSTNQLISSGKELDPRVSVIAGGVGFGGGTIALVTSTGVELKYSSTGIFGGVTTLLKATTVSTGFEFAHSRRNDLAYSELGKTAAELAVNGQNPKPVEPGNYPVIFTPHAISELFEHTIIPGLYGEQAMKGETFYSNRIDEQVASSDISFMDDARFENGINTAPWDDEGSPTQKNELIEKGVLKKYLFDRSSALEFDTISTGNAMRSGGYGDGRSYRAPPKTQAQNFMVTGPNKPFNELVAGLKKGLIVYELLGAHTANQASGDFAVNSPTLFIIEDGVITGAAKQVMISGNMGKLMEQIIGLGDDYKIVAGGLSPVAFNIPSIVIDDVKIIS